MDTKVGIFTRIWRFYRDGFREMTLGRTLWAVILIKVAVLFLVVKLFFFPSALGGLSDEQKADTVTKQLIERGHRPI